jgi:protocatechuate 3,4-dioxygenase beta subunit
MMAALLLTVAALGTGAGWLVVGSPAPATADPAAAESLSTAGGAGAAPRPAPQEPANPAEDSRRMTVTGRVLDSDGKPLPEATVVVVVRQGLRLSSWEDWVSYRNEVAGRAQTDREGKYRVTVSRPAAGTLRQVTLVAAASGHGLAWKRLDPDVWEVDAEVRLYPEHPVRGRLLDLQGEPAAGVKLHMTRLTRKPGKGWAEEDLRMPSGGLPLGIDAATTDARGAFTFRGLGPDVKLEVNINDNRYARQDGVDIDARDSEQSEDFRLVLGPPRFVEGRVTYADSGKPVAGARVEVRTVGGGGAHAQADADGRFLVNSFPPHREFPNEKGVWVGVRPPEGTPYLSGGTGFDWPGGAVVRKQVEVKLPRGVVVHGRVTEAGKGRPVAGAYLQYGERWHERVRSGPDGSYRITVPPDAGRLLVVAPTPDYIPRAVGVAEVVGKKTGTDAVLLAADLLLRGGDPAYYHAVIDLDLKPGEKTKEAGVVLRRGVTLKGSVVGPDGKPVKLAVLFVGGHQTPFERTMHPIHVRDGRFELPGCDPEKKYRLVVMERPRPVRLMLGIEGLESWGQLSLPELLGAENKLGAAVEVSAREAVRDPPVVRLAPCGSARLCVRDAAGKPVAGHTPWLQLVVSPGPTFYESLRQKTLAAEVVTLVGRYGEPTPGYTTDAEGCCTIHGLIPGATYRVKQTRQEPRNEVLREFTAEAGKTVAVDVTVK